MLSTCNYLFSILSGYIQEHVKGLQMGPKQFTEPQRNQW